MTKEISLLAVYYAFSKTFSFAGTIYLLRDLDLIEIRNFIVLDNPEKTGKDIWGLHAKHYKHQLTSRSYLDMGTDFLSNLKKYINE